MAARAYNNPAVYNNGYATGGQTRAGAWSVPGAQQQPGGVAMQPMTPTRGAALQHQGGPYQQPLPQPAGQYGQMYGNGAAAGYK